MLLRITLLLCSLVTPTHGLSLRKRVVNQISGGKVLSSKVDVAEHVIANEAVTKLSREDARKAVFDFMLNTIVLKKSEQGTFKNERADKFVKLLGAFKKLCDSESNVMSVATKLKLTTFNIEGPKKGTLYTLVTDSIKSDTCMQSISQDILDYYMAYLKHKNYKKLHEKYGKDVWANFDKQSQADIELDVPDQPDEEANCGVTGDREYEFFCMRVCEDKGPVSYTEAKDFEYKKKCWANTGGKKWICCQATVT